MLQKKCYSAALYDRALKILGDSTMNHIEIPNNLLLIAAKAGEIPTGVTKTFCRSLTDNRRNGDKQLDLKNSH
jgi:hypothetical protein